MALQPFVGPWHLLQFRNLFYTDGRTPWTSVTSLSQGRYLRTGQHKHRINAYTYIHALNDIRTHDPSVRASEDSPCLRPRCHRDRYISEDSTLKFWNFCNINAYTILPVGLCYFTQLKFSSVYIIPLQIFISNSRYTKCVVRSPVNVFHSGGSSPRH
jgi:hypothetical protein